MSFSKIVLIVGRYVRASGNGPAALILAAPVFLKIKINFHFCKKQVVNKSASVIIDLVRLITVYSAIIDRKSISRGARLSAAHVLCLQYILLCKS